MAEEAKSSTEDCLEAVVAQVSSADVLIDLHQLPKKKLSNDELIPHAEEFCKLLSKFETQWEDPNVFVFYLLSARWLNQWKLYVSYEEIIEKRQAPPEGHGKTHPGQFNSDIVDPKCESYIKRKEQLPSEIILLPNLSENNDYVIVSREVMQFFYDHYEGIIVERKAYLTENQQKRVTANFTKLNIVLINNELLKNIDLKRVLKIDTRYLQISPKTNMRELKQYLIEVIEQYLPSDHYVKFVRNPEYLRVWKLDSDINVEQLHSYLHEICHKTNSYDYRVEMKGTFLEKDEELKVEEFGLGERDHLVIEVRADGKGWNFIQTGVPGLEKCEYCSRYGLLKCSCSCKKASYCSDECKMKDRRFHSMRCEKAGESDEEVEDFVEKPNARRGLVGLTNLGNTCFMNSALQCLSNTVDLTNYFLSKRYLTEINDANPLGSKGRLAKKYAQLIKNLWFEKNDVYSPYNLKTLVGRLNQMFQGYNQHDSQEFVSFLLDGLHEDLNRVRTKPYVESVDSDGKNEKEIAKKSWENHLLRNRSHIVDLMHGQYRSQLTCPECKKISITYDPFSTLTLPIPGKESKTIEFFFIHHDNHDKPYKLSMRFKPNNHKIADLKRETATLLNKDVNTFDFVFLTYTSVKKDLKSSMDTVDARKKRKLLNMFALEKSPEVISWPQEDIIEVHILMSKNVHYYSNSYIKRTFTFMRPFWFLKSMTLSDIHMRIFHYYRFLFEEYDADTEAEKKKLRETSDEELYEKYFSKPKERPYKVLLVTNARYQTPCFYCGDPKCENCELPNHQNVLLSTIMAKIREEEDTQNKFAFELEVYWDRAPENFDLSRMNSCVDYQKKLKEGAASNGPDFKETPGAKAECKTIYDCFEFFQSPETLGEDNEWYCNICKKHQRATKQMSLYKAPRILVIHLKRFKGSGSYNKSKITDRIDFPIEDLDLSNYVRDSSLPEDYENESILQSISGGMEIEEKATEEGMELESNKEQKIQEEPLEMVKPEIINEEQKESTEKENTIEMEIKKGPVGGDQNDKVLYDLYAVSNHYGNLGFGHYTAYAKNNGEWYYFDDSSVSKARKSDIPGEASYLLFYKRKNLSELKHKTATEVTQSEV